MDGVLATSNDLTRGITRSQGQHQKGLSRNTINSQQMGQQLEKEDRW